MQERNGYLDYARSAALRRTLQKLDLLDTPPTPQMSSFQQIVNNMVGHMQNAGVRMDQMAHGTVLNTLLEAIALEIDKK